MAATFTFKCTTCGQDHEGIPTFAFHYPMTYFAVPEDERSSRVQYSEDACVIDEKYFFVRGCLNISVHNHKDPFIWGMWVSLSEKSFHTYAETFDDKGRPEAGPFFGWLSGLPSIYPEADLKTNVHLRPYPLRPSIELEPTDHPLAVEQREGISEARLQEIVQAIMHGQ